MRDQRRPRIFPGTDVRYGSIFFCVMRKNRCRKQIKIGTNTIFWSCVCLNCCWCHLEILEVGQGHFPQNVMTGLSGSDSQSASSSPLKIKSNVAFKTVLSSAPALCNYSLDRGNGRRADGWMTSMHLWCKTTMSWIRCKCLLTFCKVSPLYLQKTLSLPFKGNVFFCSDRSYGSAEQKA